MTDFIPDIPRLYTALAEWLGCMIYVFLLRRRLTGARLYVACAASLALLGALQLVAGRLPLVWWLPCMLAAALMMGLVLQWCCELRLPDVFYCTARAFTVAEFAASLEWQLACYYFGEGIVEHTPGALFMLMVIYCAVYGCVLFAESRQMPRGGRLGVSRRELWNSVFICVLVFAVSNLSFVDASTPFSGRRAPEIFYIRTLVDLCGMIVLYTQQEQRRSMEMKQELAAIQNLLQRQYSQYQTSKESIDLINRKYHDLKHQIGIIRAETDPDKREEYLRDMQHGLHLVEAQTKTGNSVLDTVLTGKSLYCAEHGITLTTVADGAQLEFMSVMDLCTIFGNALDNAIESVERLPDPEKRLIRVAVYAQNGFVMVRFENYCAQKLHFEGRLPRTTKADRQFHGYGLKSIFYTAEKYGGTATVHAENEWFVLRILFPLQQSAAGAENRND